MGEVVIIGGCPGGILKDLHLDAAPLFLGQSRQPQLLSERVFLGARLDGAHSEKEGGTEARIKLS